MKEADLSKFYIGRDIDSLSKNYSEDIIQGEVNPLEAIVVVSAMAKFSKSVADNILVRDAVKEELAKYASKTVKFKGATFTLKTVSTKYDFTVCDDPVWRDLKEAAKRADMELKEREEMLKSIPHGGITVMDDRTGEICLVTRPEKKTEDGYSITLTS